MATLVQVLHTAKEKEPFHTGEREVGRTIVNRVLGFSLTYSLSGKKRSLSSSCWALLFSKDLRVPLFWSPSLFNWGFCLLIFYTFPFGQELSMKESVFLFLVVFCPSVLGRTFLGCSVSCQKESEQIKNILMSRLSHKER